MCIRDSCTFVFVYRHNKGFLTLYGVVGKAFRTIRGFEAVLGWFAMFFRFQVGAKSHYRNPKNGLRAYKVAVSGVQFRVLLDLF